MHCQDSVSPTVTKATPWLDGHLHIFSHSLETISKARYRPQYDATLSEHLILQRTYGLCGGLVVQPSFLGTNNTHLLETLKTAEDKAPDMCFKGVAVVDPNTPTEKLNQLNEMGIVGIRLNLLQSQIPDLGTAHWQTLFQRVNDHNWHVEIQLEGERLPKVLPILVASCKRVVVDHFGRPNASNPLACPGFRSIANDTSDRLWVKTSAPYRVFPKIARVKAARLCTELGIHYQSALGSSALVWGSDWPWTENAQGLTFAEIIEWRTRWSEHFTSNGLVTLTPQLVCGAYSGPT